MISAKRSGVITDVPSMTNGYRYTVITEDGDTVHLSGLGAPKNGEVGDLGTITYRRNLFVWDPTPKN